MLSIPVKKSQSSEGFGPALLTYIQRNYGEGEAARFRNLASSLDGARSASAEAAAELCRLESESSGESSAVAVARVALASGPDRSVEGAAVEACARDLRRYGVELLAAQRRVPDADSAMESFMCEWDDGWARSGAAADAPEKEEKKDGARTFLQKAKGHLKELKKGSLKKSGSKSSLPPLERQRGSLRLERGATLYNLACCESFAGAAVDRSGERGVKQACRHFLKAAGLFEYLRRSSRAAGRRGAAAAWGCLVLDGDDVVVDLSVGALDFCEHLMLAQAQACFYEKAIAARHAAEAEGRANGAALGPGVVARLAAHAAHCYWKARASCAEPDVEDEDPKALEELLGTNAKEQACFAEGAHASLLPSFLGSAPAAKSKLRNVDDSWANHAEFQARCFEAAASFWSAKAKEEEAAASGEGYGLLVAYLDLADRHCVGALRVAARPKCRASGDALKTVQGLRELAKSLRDAVAADNAQIYRETVPHWSDRDAVPRPKGARLAKATLPDARLIGAPGTKPSAIVTAADKAAEQLFGEERQARSALRGLLPNSARSAVEAHAEAAARDSKDALQRCADADEFVRAALQSLDVPQCLDDFDDAVSFATHGALPEGLRRQCQASRSRAATFFHAGDGDKDLSACLDALRDERARAESARADAAAAVDRALAEEDPDKDDDDGTKQDDQAALAVQRMLGVLPGAAPSTAESAFAATRRRALAAKQRLAACAASDAPVDAELDDPALEAALKALDDALDRDAAPTVAHSLEFGSDLVDAAAACRGAYGALAAHGDARRVAARNLAAVAEKELGDALAQVDVLADGGLPLLGTDEPADEAAWRDDGDALDLAVPDESEDRRPEDDDVPPPPPPAVARSPRGRERDAVEASRALLAALQLRYDAVVAPEVDAARRASEALQALVDDLAARRGDFDTAARRDPAARAAEDALRRVHAGAATFERLAASLAERTSTYADICREANRRDAEAVDDAAADAAAPPVSAAPPVYGDAPAAPPVYGDAPAAPPVYGDAPAPYAAAALPAYGAAPALPAGWAAPAAPAYGAPAAPAYTAPAAPAYAAPAAPAYGAPAAPAYGGAPAAPAFGLPSLPSYGAPAPAAPSRQQQELDDEALARRLAASFEQEDAAAAAAPAPRPAPAYQPAAPAYRPPEPPAPAYRPPAAPTPAYKPPAAPTPAYKPPEPYRPAYAAPPAPPAARPAPSFDYATLGVSAGRGNDDRRRQEEADAALAARLAAEDGPAPGGESDAALAARLAREEGTYPTPDYHFKAPRAPAPPPAPPAPPAYGAAPPPAYPPASFGAPPPFPGAAPAYGAARPPPAYGAPRGSAGAALQAASSGAPPPPASAYGAPPPPLSRAANGYDDARPRGAFDSPRGPGGRRADWDDARPGGAFGGAYDAARPGGAFGGNAYDDARPGGAFGGGGGPSGMPPSAFG